MHDTYSNHKRKKLIRDFLLSKFEFESVIGLAGPDINEYIEYMESKGCKEFQLYETSPSILIKQLLTLKRKCNLNYKDILSAPYPFKRNTLFDLDFCSSAEHMGDYIKKFKNNFIMTFSLRPFGTEMTLSKFFRERKEKVVNKIVYNNPITYTIFKTNKGEYIYASYRDTVPMCCIAKIN